LDNFLNQVGTGRMILILLWNILSNLKESILNNLKKTDTIEQEEVKEL